MEGESGGREVAPAAGLPGAGRGDGEEGLGQAGKLVKTGRGPQG